MKWLPIAASLAFAWVSAPAMASPVPPAKAARQASSSSSTSPAPTHASHKKSKKRHSKRTLTQKAPTADRISEIQSALARGGYYQGDPNGKWDSNTIAAVQKFQSAKGMEATGKLDAPTLQKLGLGSDIAGVSAPKPVMPNCCSASPAASPAPQPQSSTPSTGSTTTASNTTAASTADTKPAQH